MIPSRARPSAVVIGGSAGSLDPLVAIVQALPGALEAAVITVLHLPPDAPSGLAATFRPRSALPVRDPEDKAPVAAGVLYFAPPGYHLLVERDRTFSFSIDEPVQFSRPSIDVLFESAAAAYRRSLLAILLSGANADGAAGLEAVARHGGTAIVQAPETARSPEMPRAGLSRVRTAMALPPDAIARLVSALAGPGTQEGVEPR